MLDQMTVPASRSHNRNVPGQAAPSRILSSTNPYTGEKMKDYLEMTPEEVERAIANAHQRFTAWRRWRPRRLISRRVEAPAIYFALTQRK